MADTFVKKPVLLVGEKDEIVPQMGENDLGVATDVEFYTKQEVDDLVAQSGGASLPDQTGNAGKVLRTNGTDTEWTDDYLPSTGGTMTGPITFTGGGFSFSIEGKDWGVLRFGATFDMDVSSLSPVIGSNFNLGQSSKRWDIIYANFINSGGENITIPTEGGTLARVEDIDTIGGVGTTGQVLTKTDDGFAWQDSAGGGASLPILLSVLSDHVLNDISWLRSDTFSWQSGDVYVAAYNHLAADFDGKQGTKWYSWGYTEDYDIFYTLSAAPAVGDLAFTVDGDNIVSVVKITAYTPETEDGVPATITLGGIAFNSRGELFEVKPFVDFAYNPNVSAYAYVLYYVAEDGHKICMPDQESNVSQLYETTGAADYYILDTTNKQFKLPRNYQPKRTLIRMANNADGTWYKLYSDGWVEQGGYDSTNFNTRTWTYPVAMSDTNYTLTLSVGYVNIDTQNGKFGVTSRTETGFSYKVISLGGNAVGDNMSWRVEGYSAVQGGGVQRKYEYYYVGNFTQEAIEQTAGLNAELFNGKADSDLKNIPSNYDYVVESQMPTAENNYTWYRKYKSGWVEQGMVQSSDGERLIFPVPFSDANYTVAISGIGSTHTGGYPVITEQTATTINVTYKNRIYCCGMAAQ